MRYVDRDGLLAKARRYSNAVSSIYDESLKDTQKLGEILRGIVNRLTSVEARTPPEAVEIEKVVSAGGAVTEFTHNFKCPVRWYVVDWAKSSAATPTTAPILVRNQDTSTEDVLVLSSYTAGKVVLRIEPAQAVIAKV